MSRLRFFARELTIASIEKGRRLRTAPFFVG